MSSKETLDKARELLTDMAKLADNQPFNLTHSEYVAKMWMAFNKGRKYGNFVSKEGIINE